MQKGIRITEPERLTSGPLSAASASPLVGQIDLASPASVVEIGSPLRMQQAATIASLYLGYAMSMVLRMIPTVAGAAIREDPSLGIDLEVWGRILAVGTCGAVVGKFICGYAADKFGGKLTFTVGLLIASLFVGVFGFASEVWMFRGAIFVTLMAQSAGWPSMARIIINWFPPRQYGRVWGILSTSSRVGTLLATFCLGSLLAWMSWRGMLWLAAGLGIATFAAFSLLLKERPDTANHLSDDPDTPAGPPPAPPHPLHGTSLSEAIPKILTSPRFWLIAGSLMGLTILWDFLLFVPMYLQDTLGLSAADASQAASAFPFGSLLSVLAGGFVFDKLKRGTTAWVMGLLLTIATGCLVAFLVLPHFDLSSRTSLWISLGLLFVFGLCVSPCYYIPMSVFSIEFGGPHSGFLIALLDAMSFAATAVFSYFGGGLAKQSWTLYLSALLAVSVWSALTTLLFMLGEARTRRQEVPA